MARLVRDDPDAALLGAVEARWRRLGAMLPILLRNALPTMPPWVQHDLIFENTGDRPVTIGDTRTAVFLTLAGSPDCWSRLPVTLFRDLRGMGAVLEGSYVFERAIEFRFGLRAPNEAHGHRSVLELTYDLAPA